MKATRIALGLARLLLIATCALSVVGCSKKKITQPNGGATDLVTQANLELEAVLVALMNAPEPQRPSDVNFSGPLARYEQALAIDPNHPGANFGAGVLTLLSLSYDTEVNAAFDEWDAYLQAHVPFEAPPPPSPLRPLGVPTTFRSGLDAYRLPFALVPRTLLAPARATQVAADPQISRVQAILRDRALPRLGSCISRLGITAANTGFQFVITPGMQGDPNASPVEIDHTDILALKAAAELLAAGCNVAVAYDLGFASYDSLGLVNALNPGGNWLKLNSGGAANMLGARSALLASLDDVLASISSLVAEIDPQDDDFIKRGSSGISDAGLDSVVSRSAQVREALTSGFTLLGDWDGRSATPMTYLTIRADRLFAQPVPDWKALLPGYAASAVRRPFNTQFFYDSGVSAATATLPAPGNYEGMFIINISSGQRQDTYYGSDSLLTPCGRVADERYAILSSTPGFTGSGSIVTRVYSAFFAAGTQPVTVYWEAYYTLAATEVFVPVITWTADDYAQWIWPSPTLNGLLPQMSTSSELLSTFGFDPGMWTKIVILDWTGSGLAGVSAPRPGLP